MTETRYVQLKWRMIAAIVRKATGLPYIGARAYGVGFHAEKHFRDGGVVVTLVERTRGRHDPTEAEAEAAYVRQSDHCARILAALRAEGYEAVPRGIAGILVTKPAPPATELKEGCPK